MGHAELRLLLTLIKALEGSQRLKNGIFGVGCTTFKTGSGQKRLESEVLWTILASETVHLIWKLQCEQVIRNGGADFTE